MINITLFKFSKKRNSTALPVITGSGANTQRRMFGVVRNNVSLSTPIVDIEEDHGGLVDDNIYEYNYAYIFSFNRYYFVDDIRYNNPTWTFYLTVDVLASYKEDIINTRQYVLRSASQWDTDIPDSFYPTLPKSSGVYAEEIFEGNALRYNTQTGDWLDAPFFNVPVSSGAVVAGILSSSTTGVTYYAFNIRSFNNFLQYAFSLVPSNMTSLDSGVARALFNPIQYISSARWYPALPLIGNTGGSVSSIKLGGETITLDSLDICYQLNTFNVESFKISMVLPRHPDYAGYSYTKLSPYSQYNLFFQPFGDIPLDSYKIYDNSAIDVKWDIDYLTGSTSLRIYSQLGNRLVYNDIASLGVPIPISSLVYDTKTGLALTGLQFLKTVSGENVSFDYPFKREIEYLAESTRKNAFGISDYELKPLLPSFDSTDNANSIDSIMDAIGTSLGQVVSNGSVNSFLAYNMGKPFIYAWFMKQAEKDNDRFGRPLRQRVRLDSLSGYTVCANATVSFESTQYPTDREHARILAYLNGGFYLE